MKLEYMQKAIKLAKTSGKDIPVGAIIVKNGEIISKAVNQREKRQNAIYHAEILAIRRACRKLKNWRLNDCEIYVTLEPCPMCASAILQARIGKIYFGAYDFLNGAFGSKSDMRTIMNYSAKVKGGIMEEDCANLLKDYFESMR
ncbi:MAG: nucleoside deaminase [Cyanobacteria bacterium SIG29]|nr:nucleoside deaminase [Cyanobacteria bacterium SIG29]